MESPDQIISQLAGRQHGAIARRQALEAGLSSRQIDRRTAMGRWQRSAVGVYVIAGSPPIWERQVMSATLSVDGSVASWLTAAKLHHLITSAPPVPHVTIPYGRSPRAGVAIVHRARLSPVDTTIIDAIAVTTRARTLVDLAAVVGPRHLQRMVDEAMHRGSTAAEVDDAWHRSQRAPGRWGRAALLTALTDWRNPIRPGSPAEARLLRQLREWGFPDPERQIPIVDRDGRVIARIDGGWQHAKVGIEYDSERWHDATRWDAEHHRQAAIEAQGWTLLHADKRDLRPGSGDLRRRIAAALRAAAA